MQYLFIVFFFSVGVVISFRLVLNKFQIIQFSDDFVFFFLFSLSNFYRELHDGTSIKENGIMDGSKIILLPNVETGLLVNTIFFCY